MSKQLRVLCGVPKEYCIGGPLVTKQMLNTDKCHGSHDDAFRCMAHYLTKVLGYTRIGGREFRPPDGGPIKVLTKKIRYGERIVAGKEGRFMPERRNVGNRGVILVK